MKTYRDTSDEIIEHLEGKKGFDYWWHEISDDIKKEIKEELSEILKLNTIPRE